MAKEETKKRIRRDKKTILTEKIEVLSGKIAVMQDKIENAQAKLTSLKEELELADNIELKKQKEEEQKKINKLIKEKGLTLEQLEELLK